MKQVPNILTSIRLIMIPIYFQVFYSDQPNALRNALIIFILASITDVLDGYIARKYDAQSKFGAIFDPLADKLMQLSVIYTLTDAGYLTSWFFNIILTKEILQMLVGGILAGSKKRLVIPANYFGKATTVLIFVTIILSVFDLGFIKQLQTLVLVLAVITIAQYAYHAFKAITQQRA